MQLSLQTFTTLVQNMAAAVQGSARSLVDLTVGSVLRAILEASAGIGLWMQWLILQVQALTRASTSTGADLDTWVADFGLARLPAVAATGEVTLARFSTTLAALIPVGASLKSADGTVSFAVTADSTHEDWSASQNGYTLAAGTASITVPVQALTAGVTGNVLADTITLIASAIPSVDSVTNDNALVNGIDAEADEDLRARFQGYINSRSRATPVAVGYAVSSVQQGLSYTIQENEDATGAYTPGTFVVSFDDGSGAPPDSLLDAVTEAVQAVRPIGSVAVVQKADLLAANVSMTISCATTAQKNAAIPLVNAAIAAYIGALGVGETLPYSRLAMLAYAADANILNVTSTLLNAGTADLNPDDDQVVRAGTITVN
jgi:uncharacterized phage protein gp47/JayE